MRDDHCRLALHHSRPLLLLLRQKARPRLHRTRERAPTHANRKQRDPANTEALGERIITPLRFFLIIQVVSSEITKANGIIR